MRTVAVNRVLEIGTRTFTSSRFEHTRTYTSTQTSRHAPIRKSIRDFRYLSLFVSATKTPVDFRDRDLGTSAISQRPFPRDVNH